MNTKSKITLSLIALLTAFAFGRFSAPEKIKIETKVVEVEKKEVQKDLDKQVHKKTITKTTTKPDGTKSTTTITQDDSTFNAKTDSKSEIDKSSDTLKEVTRSSSKVTVQGLAAVNPFHLQNGLDLGASVCKPILGPLTVGIFGFRSGTVGASAGLTF